jgi:hypothetical protein
LEGLERIRALIEERWQAGPGRDTALCALEELIAERSLTEGEEEAD